MTNLNYAYRYFSIECLTTSENNFLYLQLEGEKTFKNFVASVGPRAEKLNIVNNDHGRPLCFRPEIPFLGKFSPKNQNCQFELKSDT